MSLKNSIYLIMETTLKLNSIRKTVVAPVIKGTISKIIIRYVD